MSIGNLKDSGNQGNNLPWQWKVLKGLQAILDETAQPLTCDDKVSVCFNDGVSDITVSSTNPLPTLATINCVDSAIKICDGVDTLGINTDGSINTNIYGNNGGIPTAVAVDTAGELQVDVLTMPATFAEDTAHVSGNTGAFVMGVRNDLNTVMTNADGDYSPIAVNNKGAVAIQDGGNSITVDSNAAVRTPIILRTSTNSSIAAGAYSMSFASVGTADATVGGFALKPGETINFDAGAINNTLGAVVYDSSAPGAELLIITLT
tara:strand:+ start:2613 stop:3401 length:789 start_codon:yes stop_codon:yes gene_type:complete